MILLLPTSTTSGRWDVLAEARTRDEQRSPAQPNQVVRLTHAPDVHKLDAALRQVLRTYAIDPAKMAVTGMSEGGGYALFIGRNNLDVFSRIAALSLSENFVGAGPENPATQIFLSRSSRQAPQSHATSHKFRRVRTGKHRGSGIGPECPSAPLADRNQ